MGSAGASNTSALAFGGNTPPGANYKDETELWNGTNWTEVNDLNTARQYIAGTGIQASALAFGGEPVPSNGGKTEEWNGSGWAEVADLNTARKGSAGTGTTTAGLASGGYITAETAATEEWSSSSNTVKTLTD